MTAKNNVLKACLFVFALCVAIGGYGQTWRVWKGSDGNLSKPENWDPYGSPEATDWLVFNNSATITEDFALPGSIYLYVATGKSLNLNGSISGSSEKSITIGLNANMAGNVYFNGNNTFEGMLDVLLGNAYGTTAGAFGSGSASKIRASNSACIYFQGVSCGKEVNFNGQGNRIAFYFSGNNTLGKFSSLNATWYMQIDGGATTFTGGATYGNIVGTYLKNGAELVISGMPWTMNRAYHAASWNGVYVFACEGNKLAYYGTEQHDWNCRLDVNDAFTSDTQFYMGSAGSQYENNPNLYLDLNGTTQRIERLANRSATIKYPGKVMSAEGGLVTVTASADLVNAMAFEGKSSFEVEMGIANKIEMYGASTSSGDLIASSGAIHLKSGSKWSGTLWARGGTIKVEDLSAVPESAKIRLESGTVEIPSGTIAISALYDADGKALPMGSYKKGDVPGLSGEGTVSVVPGQEPECGPWVWTGNGADHKVSTAANWESAPTDFMSTGNVFSFPPDAEVVFDRAVTAKRIEFNGTTDGASRFDATDEGLLTIYRGLIEVAETGAKTIVFDVPIQYYKSFEYNVPTGNQLDFVGRLTSIGSAEMVRRGRGIVSITGDDNVLQGDVVNSNGVMYVRGAAPLGGEGVLKNYQSTSYYADDQIRFENAVVDRDVKNYPSGAAQTNPHQFVVSVAGSTNVIGGSVVNTATIHCYFSMQERSQMEIGGLQPGNLFIPDCGVGSLLRIAETPVTTGHQYYQVADNNSIVALAVAGNKFGSNKTAEMRVGSTLRTEVDGAIASDRFVSQWKGYSLLDVYGTTQRVSYVARTPVTTDAGGKVTKLGGDGSKSQVGGTIVGPVGSYLAFVGSEADTIAPVFAGIVSFERAGTGTTVFREPNMSTGDLIVTGGRVEMAAPGSTWTYKDVEQTYGTTGGGSWAGEKIVVTGGVLAIGHKNALSRTAEIYVDGGKIAIADGVVLKSSALYVKDGDKWKMLSAGIYGSSTSGAQNKRDDIFDSGSKGVLRNGRIGLAVVFR